MGKVIRKVFWVWEFEKEEAWLNDLASRGLLLTDVGFFRYVFEQGTPGEYQYRIEMLKHFPEHPQSQEYLRFMEETGAQYVASLKRWVYFRKKADEEQPFEVYSDIDSRIAHLRRCGALLFFLLALAAGAGLYQLLVGIHSEMMLYIGSAVFILLACVFLLSGAIRILCKIKLLKKERSIHE